MTGQHHDIAAVCPKCRRLWQEPGGPDAILETWRAEAVETFARWVALEPVPPSMPKSESTRAAIARRWRTWKLGLLV
jgi:Zn-finger nucleic acid-binding protein